MKIWLPKTHKRKLLKKYVILRKKVADAWNKCPKLKKIQIIEGEFSEFQLWECTPDHVIVGAPLPWRAKPITWSDIKIQVVTKDCNVLIFIVNAPLEQVKNILSRTIKRHRAPYWDSNRTAYWDCGWKWKIRGHTAHAFWDTLDGRTIVMCIRPTGIWDSSAYLQTQKEYYKMWSNGMYRNKGLPTEEFDTTTCGLQGLENSLRERAFVHMREQVKRVVYMRLCAAAGCEDNIAPVRRRRL